MKKLITISIMLFLWLSALFLESGRLFASPDVVYKKARSIMGLQKTSKPPEYVYDPTNKTDPFAPFIVRRPKTLSQLEKEATSEQLLKILSMLKDLKKPRTELQRIEISDLVLTAIIKTHGKVVAMVKGPEKSRGYMIKKGTFIGTNGGVVEEIISEERKTVLGKQLIRKVIIKEPYLDNDGKLRYRRIEMKMPGSYFE